VIQKGLVVLQTRAIPGFTTMFNFFASGATLLAYAVAALAVPQRADLPPINIPAVPAPPGFNITSLGVNGSGCPPGTTYYALNVDKTAVTHL